MSDDGAKLLHAIIRARTTSSASEPPPWAALSEDERDDYRNVARLERATPDLPTPPPTDDEPECICKPFGAVGQNPECDEHPWWRNDTAVLDLADLTWELRSPWEAARARFGGGS